MGLKISVFYAYMPVKTSTPHPELGRLPAALLARMKALGHTQLDVARETGVPQPQISRALRGKRKRLTAPISALCRYAGLDSHEPQSGASPADLARLVVQLSGDDPSAAAALQTVLSGIAELIQQRTRSKPDQNG
jgi:transcriptional regulator with XRE-family HTH domain